MPKCFFFIIVSRINKMRMLNALLFVVGLCLVSTSKAAFQSGDMKDVTDGFKIFGVFCFGDADSLSEQVGTMNIDLKSSTASTAHVVIYTDEDSSFPMVFDDDTGTYIDGMSCTDRIKHAKNWNDNSQSLISWNSVSTAVDFEKTDGTFTADYSIFQQARPRFWYIGLANCDDQHALQSVTYETHFLNFLVADKAWEEEFGFDVDGLQTLYLCYFLFFTIYMGVHGYGVKGLHDQLSYVHPLVKLFTCVITLEWISLFLYLIHYGTYAGDGVGIITLYYFGEVLDLMSRLAFLMLLMLVAKGWTISSEALEGKKLIVGVFTFVLFIDIMLMLWEYGVRIPEAVSVPLALAIFQYISITFWIIFALWYGKTAYSSYQDEQSPPKKSFYISLGTAYFIWILCVPVFAYVGLVVAPWVLVKTSVSLTVTTTLVGYCGFTFLIWPSRATDYFSINVPQVSTGALDYARL